MVIINWTKLQKNSCSRQNKPQHYNLAKKVHSLILVYPCMVWFCVFCCRNSSQPKLGFIAKLAIQSTCSWTVPCGWVYLEWTMRRRNDKGICFSDHFLSGLLGTNYPTNLSLRKLDRGLRLTREVEKCFTYFGPTWWKCQFFTYLWDDKGNESLGKNIQFWISNLIICSF